MATDFRALLADTSDTVERPKALPEAWLIGKIGQHSCGNSRAKQTPFVRFTLLASELHPQYATDELRKIVAALAEPDSTKNLSTSVSSPSTPGSPQTQNIASRIFSTE